MKRLEINKHYSIIPFIQGRENGNKHLQQLLPLSRQTPKHFISLDDYKREFFYQTRRDRTTFIFYVYILTNNCCSITQEVYFQRKQKDWEKEKTFLEIFGKFQYLFWHTVVTLGENYTPLVDLEVNISRATSQK